MILPAGPLRVYLATRPVDFRKGMDGLAALAQAQLQLDPFSGAVLVFRAKRADRVKLLVFDGTGLCLYSKRLEAVPVHGFETPRFAYAAMSAGPSRSARTWAGVL
jgi:transposase